MESNRITRAAALFKKWSPHFCRNVYDSTTLRERQGPRILMNSLPKAGTNLLEQTLIELPNLRRQGYRTLRGWESVDVNTMSSIRKIKNGGISIGHLPAHDSLVDLLAKTDIKVLFMVRDPRDLVISYVNYVTHGNKTHPAHKYFASLENQETRIQAAIEGVTGIVSPLSTTLEIFYGWFETDALIVRFEDLIGEKGGGDERSQQETVDRILDYLNIDLTANERSNLITNIFNPNAITFRNPSVEGWRNIFTEANHRTINDLSGEWILRYGFDLCQEYKI